MVSLEAEQPHNLGYNFGVLAGEHYADIEIIGLLESVDYRRQLDRPGPGAQHNSY